MKRFATLSLAAVALALPGLAHAEGGDGSRQAAGGGHMSSYVNDPYHNPKSLHSQRLGTGQIAGSPMFHDGPGSVVTRREVVSPNWAAGGAPHWASGTAPRRAKR
ncbi:hypothetical protein [Methylobacterium aerolatum]|uniref:Uncharacterized protein n=1 Tax=Methylobacterium aerolatum TaxID=418708 RepID=A0ABU0I533_9HYPH|nr:hypothetical protein [Methylobacterium aerolatum]MDQ0449731.1 hypothetical protein [Methylobacterium aerolatum]GJD37162.1 hypothetical protein FMGBMHLM_4088 [Methylobacterium aerolatum]